MCGIAGIHIRGDKQIEQLGRLADGLLYGIRHRGGDATGILAMLPSGKVQRHRVVSTGKGDGVVKFIRERPSFQGNARTVLLHTRFATRGRADDVRNAHPVMYGDAAAIHNGTISNDSALFAKHGMKRTADVDSIVIPALVDKLGWNRVDEALNQLRGGAATAIVHKQHPTEVVLARLRTYPLHVLTTDEVVVWASERRAIEWTWAALYGAEPQGEWLDVPEHTMLRINGAVERVDLPVPTYQ